MTPPKPDISTYSHAWGTWQMWRWGPDERSACTESVVLLHAAASHPQTFARLAQALVTPGREILAPALNGYASSLFAEDRDPVATHVAIARAALEQVAAPRTTTLFGHSMGGLIALLTALAVPQLRALALYDPIVMGVLDPARPEHDAGLNWDRAIIARLSERVAKGDPESGVAAFVEGWNETRWQDLPSAIRQTLVSQAGNLARDAKVISYYPLESTRLDNLAVPTTVLHGEHSPPVIGHIARALAQHRPQLITARALAGCGHMAPAVQPERVSTALAGVLG